MSTIPKEKGYSNLLSFIFSIIFLGLAAIGAYMIIILHGENALVQEITPWNFTIITLATYRLTRLFVYDSIFQFFRDFFLDQKSEMKDGRIYITYSKPKYHTFGIRGMFADLLECPWCTGVWLSLFTVFAFYATPYSWPFLIILAVAGVSTFIQILMNQVGWHAENAKIECQKKRNNNS